MHKNKLVLFNESTKERTLEKAKIDSGIRKLSDAINSIPCLMTMNSCEGQAYNDGANHCPSTYVDFYVIGDNHDIAENLMILLSSELVDDFMAQEVDISVRYEQDYKSTIDNDGNYRYEYTNLVRKRYQIVFMDERYSNSEHKHVQDAIRWHTRDRVEKATQLVIQYRNAILSKNESK